MNVYHWPHDGCPERAPRVIAVGAFDGVHLGHQRVLASLCAEANARSARSCVVTFEPTPAQFFSPRPPHNLRLSPGDERLELLRELCIDEVCVLDFTLSDVRRLTAAEFLQCVVRDWLGGVAICGSGSHDLGSDRVPWPQVVEMARHMGIEPIATDLQTRDGRIISSTEIRELIWRGRVEEAAQMLGRDYTVTGIVGTGKRAGARIGFPTANLDPPADKLVPAEGVYAGWAASDALEPGPLELPQGAWPAAINIGHCPTVGGQTCQTFEVHIIGWSGDLRGRELTVGFIRRLRSERRFAGIEDLRERIAADVRMAETIAHEHAAALLRQR